jgi:catechol 2,3-dioxygenase-like lactoylglutathione lyase family enzyme
MLADAPMMAFVSAVDLDRARAFYQEVLGLAVEEVNDFACVMRSGGTSLRITRVGSLAPQPFTVLGWEVDDIESTVDGLTLRGTIFERYDGMSQDERGIWTSPRRRTQAEPRSHGSPTPTATSSR